MHLTALTRNRRHRVTFGIEFKDTVEEIPIHCPKSRPGWDGLGANVMLQQIESLPVGSKLAQEWSK